MQSAEIPDNEKDRIAALYELNILDTPREERFDRITRVASTLFKTPIAYIAMVDANRQWFKSSCGLTSHETGRDVSFCSHTILQDEPLIIPDTHLDFRFSDNPLVLEDPFLRFYAGCPLKTADGFKVATLCIGDKAPRQTKDIAIDLLNDLAHMVEDQLNLFSVTALQREVRSAKYELEKSNKKLELQNNFIREVFGRFITDEVAEVLLQSPAGLKLGGEKQLVTILMADVRGFTTISEKLPAEVVVSALNRYFEAMVSVISKFGGTIDSFIGDGMLVIFGAPIKYEDAAKRAVACALEMQHRIKALNDENTKLGLPCFKIGIGINTGEVIVGNIGSEKRMKYSVIGSPVNIASRVESFTIGGQVLITQETLQYVKDIVRVDGKLRVKMKGLEENVCIYDVGAIG